MIPPVFYPLCVGVLSGVLCGIGFLVPILWPLALVGLVPLLSVVTNAHCSRWSTFSAGWLAGVVINGFATYAVFWHTLPIDWLGVFLPRIQPLLVLVSWLLPVMSMGLATGLFALLVRALWKNTWHDICIVTSAWTLSGWLSSILFSIVTLGSGSAVYDHFSLGLMGNLAANNAALLQLAPLGGVYLLSAFFAVSNALLLFTFRASVRTTRVVVICAYGMLVVALYGAHVYVVESPTIFPDSGKPLRVVAVALWEKPVLYPSVEDDRAVVRSVLRLTHHVPNAELVVLPESTGFFRSLAAQGDAFSWRGVIVDSESSPGPHGKLLSRLEFRFHNDTREPVYSFKQFLLPDGEYVPYAFRDLISYLGERDVLQTLDAHRSFLRGVSVGPIVISGSPISVLFCNEAMSPSLYRLEVERGASILVNIASQSWFHSSQIVAKQMENVARIRAAEVRRWYVQSNNLAPALVIDPRGMVVARTEHGAEGVIVADVWPRHDETMFTRFGSWILVVSALILLGALYTRIRPRAVV